MQHSAGRLRWCMIIGALVSTCLGAKPGWADEAAPRRELGPWAQGINVGPGMDASGKILKDSVFVGLDLTNSKFDGAHLGGCEIYQCDLRGASFKNTVFAGLRWGDCRLDNADFADAVLNGIQPLHGPSAYGIRFTVSQLVSTRSYKTRDLSDCHIHFGLVNNDFVDHPLDLRGADLRRSILGYYDLRKSHLAGAKIRGATFYQCRLTGSQITSTFDCRELRQLVGVSLGEVHGPIDLSGCDLTGSSGIPSQADISDATIARCVLGVPLSREKLRSTKSYREGRLVGVFFLGQDLSGLDLSGQDLSECRFQDCDLSNVAFGEAVISHARFAVFRRKDLGLTLGQVKSTWNYKHGRMQGIELPGSIVAATGPGKRSK